MHLKLEAIDFFISEATLISLLTLVDDFLAHNPLLHLLVDGHQVLSDLSLNWVCQVESVFTIRVEAAEIESIFAHFALQR